MVLQWFVSTMLAVLAAQAAKAADDPQSPLDATAQQARSRGNAAESPYSWPQFHGPERNNLSRETGLLKEWPKEGLPLLWTTAELGHGFSSLSIANGLITTAGNVGEDTIVTALDLEGKVLWRAANGPAWTRDYPGTRSTPTLDGNRVYHQSPLGNLVCLKQDSGEVIWQVAMLEKFSSKNSRWGLAESLLVDGDHVIASPGGPQTCMVALNKHTGTTAWQAPSVDELAGYASPTLIEHGGLRMVVTLTAKAVIGVNADNGELLWHIEHESYADENVLLPIFHDGHLFISTLVAGSVKWRIDVQDGKVKLEEIWRTKEMDNHHGGVVLLDGYLYGNSTARNRNQWVCLDWETGAIKYAQPGVGKGSLTYADGLLYTLSIDRVIGLVRPTPTLFEVVSSFEIPEGGKGKSWAHPVVCNGRLYVRHSEFLYAYRVR
jgi:outer membrane protein assembly factor BamB